MSDANPSQSDRRITSLSQDVAVIKSQVSDIRISQQAMNIKLDNMSAYSRTEADGRFATKAEQANLRYLLYALISGVIGFFFYMLQTKGI